MKSNTSYLLEKLQQTTDLSSFFETYNDELITQTVGEYVGLLMEQKQMSKSELAIASGLGNYLYRVVNDERNVSRSTLLAVAFGLHLSVAQTQMLLRIGRQAMLDPRFHWDAAVLFALSSGYTLPACNDLLDELGEPTL